MDISLVCDGLATRAKTITGLNAFGYVPDSIPPPSLFTADVEIEYDDTFGRGMDTVYVTCRLLVSHADDRSGQKLLDGYLKGAGAKSVKAALEGERTLGGACMDLRVQRASGYGLYEHGTDHFYGAEFRVMIIGDGS